MKALDFLIRLAACAGKPGLDFQYGENDFGVAGWKLFLGPACAERAKVELSLATGSSWYAFSTLGKDAAPEDVAEDMLARITRQPDEPVIIKVVSALTGAAVISALWDTYNETADALAAKC